MKVLSVTMILLVLSLLTGVHSVPNGKLPARLSAGGGRGPSNHRTVGRGTASASSEAQGRVAGGSHEGALPTTSDGVAPVATLPTSNSAEGALTEIPPSPDGSIQGAAPDTSGVDPDTFFDNTAVPFIANHPRERQDYEQWSDRVLDPDSDWMEQLQAHGLDENFMDGMEALGTREQYEEMARLNVDVNIKRRLAAGRQIASDQLRNVMGEFRARYKGTRGMSTATWGRVRRAMTEGLQRDWKGALDTAAQNFRDESTRGYTAIGAGIAAAVAAQPKEDEEEDEEEEEDKDAGDTGGPADVEGQKRPRKDKDDDDEEGASAAKRICRGDLRGLRI